MSGKEGGGLGLKGDLGNGWGIGFRLWGPRIWGVCILDEGLSCRKGGVRCVGGKFRGFNL